MIDWNPCNPHRPSYAAHNTIYDMADEYYKKATEGMAYPDKKAFIDQWFGHPVCYMPSWTKKGRIDNIKGKCETWFYHNCGMMVQGFFNVKGYKNISGSIDATENYNALCDEWDEWFEKRRNNWMKKYEAKVMHEKGLPAKMPSSHGGIANLLKTLTKTMTLQGASIKSIAKVQYAICTQAGVYIPSEFLTDVAVALEYNEQMEALK